MDQNLLNFWKNYEDVMNWGYRISGAREAVGSELIVPINTQAKVRFFSLVVRVGLSK